MTTLSIIIDYFLYVLVAITLGLIAWKSVELWLPFMRKGPSQELLGSSERELQVRLESLERGLVLLAAIGAAAPFIGLMGTVMHIIEALRHLGAGVADMSLIGGPIATALNTTLVGMFSAVPAVVAHGLLQRRIELLETRHRRLLAQGAR